MAGSWFTGAGATDIGPRAENQDAFLSEGPVQIVADGMGGHAGGAQASAAVVEAFRSLAGASLVAPSDVVKAVSRARALVADVAERIFGDPGSTLTGAIAVEHEGAPWWFVINVGDSRVYAIDGASAHQITIDHSHVQDLVTLGRITKEQAEHHPDRNIITRAIGDMLPGFDGWLVRARPGLRLVIASDGLTKVVSDERIGAVAAREGKPQAAAHALVAQAIELGTNDNVTVVVADTLHARTPAHAAAGPWQVWGIDEDDEDGDTLERGSR
ncbi:PP2C family protein-serine/threonine phosphatase [Demequina sp.]|uniref:PP2C family protein-serine/threonine phosphatase n=1 Tax=Demequina sp. TaxID=2050685 RepID=UPI003A865681